MVHPFSFGWSQAGKCLARASRIDVSLFPMMRLSWSKHHHFQRLSCSTLANVQMRSAEKQAVPKDSGAARNHLWRHGKGLSVREIAP
jgi:hypothetical protein